MDGIVNNIDKIIDMAMNLLMTIITLLITNLPKVIEAGIKILVALIERTCQSHSKID